MKIVIEGTAQEITRAVHRLAAAMPIVTEAIPEAAGGWMGQTENHGLGAIHARLTDEEFRASNPSCVHGQSRTWCLTCLADRNAARSA